MVKKLHSTTSSDKEAELTLYLQSIFIHLQILD